MKILFLDIETAPNLVTVWGLWNQNVAINQILDSGYVLCWSAKWYGEKDIMFGSTFNGGTKHMLKRIHALLNEADVVVHFNGKKFDIPTLNKEFLVHGFTPPAPYKQVDLLTTARQQFKFPSNKLDYLTQALKIGQKIRHKGHELWLGCMNGDKKSWQEMEEYNIQDVVLLEKLYEKVRPWIRNHPNRGLYGNPNFCCPTCGSTSYQRRGYSYSNGRVYQRHRCKSCSSWFRDASSVPGIQRTTAQA